ncbi:hypothetical protein SAMN04515618_11796 [Collimonas sp. OK307]|uniref:hypothetical protein n=1 Tax=Collimonas sp. OK307 TaxID=1801620 RepID=UPI0008F03C11|nr:hypothetical protein [Collimonas sp. OK307]SFI32844.1 hypothetical protein SAMN04515618_11796 [Collimonas sp. OK307]
MSRTNPPKTSPVKTTSDEGAIAALSNDQRCELVEKAGSGKITSGETELLADDIHRAIEKAQLATTQVAHQDDPKFAVYAEPAIRAESATASLSQMTPVVISIAVKYKRDRKHCGTKGGDKRKEKTAPLHKRVIEAGRRLKQDGTLDRKLVSELIDKYNFNLSDKQLRTILRNNGVLPQPRQERK